VVFTFRTRNDHLARGKDKGGCLGVANTHNDGCKTLSHKAHSWLMIVASASVSFFSSAVPFKEFSRARDASTALKIAAWDRPDWYTYSGSLSRPGVKNRTEGSMATRPWHFAARTIWWRGMLYRWMCVKRASATTCKSIVIPTLVILYIPSVQCNRLEVETAIEVDWQLFCNVGTIPSTAVMCCCPSVRGVEVVGTTLVSGVDGPATAADVVPLLVAEVPLAG
jgi:hypothetical protein